MATGTKSPNEKDKFNRIKDPGQQHFENIINREFPTAERAAMQERARQGAQQDRYRRQQEQPAQNPTDPTSNDVATGDASDPRGGDLMAAENQAAESQADTPDRQADDIEGKEEQGDADWTTNVKGEDVPAPHKYQASNFVKSKQFVTTVVAIFSGTGLFFTVLLTPAWALVHLKEVWLDKFDDRLQTLMERRNTRLMYKKLASNPMTAGCGVVKVKCRFKGMSSREVRKFERRNSGTKVVLEGRTIFGKRKVKGIQYYDDAGKQRFVQAAEFKSRLKTSANFRKIVHTYNKSTVAHWRDKQAGKLFTKLKIFLGKNRSSRAPPGSDEEARERAKADREAREKVVEAKRAELKTRLGKASNALGVICLVKLIIDESKHLAKIELMVKLTELAMRFANVADDIKAGTATGDKGTQNNISELGEMLVQKDENGQTAFDSFGYQYAADGVLSKNKGAASDYQMGTKADQGIIGDIAKSVKGVPGLEQLVSLTGGMLGRACPIVLGAGLLICAIFLPDIPLVVMCGAQGFAMSKLIEKAIPPLLKLLVKTAATTGIVGGRVGNAATGGFSAVTSLNNRYRGAYPLSKDKAIEFDKFSDNAQKRGRWKDFAINEELSAPSSFFEKLTTAVMPSLTQVSSSLISVPTAAVQFSASGMSSLAIDSASARRVIDKEYDQCDDGDYKKADVAADPFCAPAYSHTPSKILGDREFNQGNTKQTSDTREIEPDNRYDADNVISYMLDDDPAFHGDRGVIQPWIDSDGEAIDWTPDQCPPPWGNNPFGIYLYCNEDYHDFLLECVETTEPISEGSKRYCKDPDKGGPYAERYNMYRMYLSDTTLDDQYQDKDANKPSGADSPEAGDGEEEEEGSITDDVSGLAQKLLELADQNKIKLDGYSSDPASDKKDRSLSSLQLEDLAAGTKAKLSTRCSYASQLPKSVAVDVKLLQFLVDLAEKTSYTINTLAGQCHTSAGSQHHQGKAVDFACGLDLGKADAAGRPHNIIHNTETCAANYHWHYSIGGG